ncbi:MAG: InlB B-repeat-containing protein [Clostridia bacterium]|nr:InlB B-repeat-containing protein [Clostridia bacterium]
MKKTVLIVVLALFFAALLIGGYVSGAQAAPEMNLYSDNGYIDYAENVFLDVDKYPDMAEMGLFWTTWDEQEQAIVQVPADSTQGASLVDPSKPTIINVHGVLLDGFYRQERFNLNTKIAEPNEFDLDTDFVSMNYLWLREGWNVANFHYNRFASENNPGLIESKIWANDGEMGVRYRHQNGEFSAADVTQYSLAEHFAAEYIRAMRLLPANMGEKEIRFTGHSMGGMLTTAALFLLTELADAGQLAQTQLPERYALLDSYFSTVLEIGDELLYVGPKDITIRWSNKPLVYNNSGATMMACLKAIAAKGIALEYYTYEVRNFLSLGAKQYAEELRKVSTYAVVYPDFQGQGYTVAGDGHNGVREWYLCSILDEPLRDTTYGDTGAMAPSAALATNRLFELYNKEFAIDEGTTTVRAYDDTMMLRFKIEYETNGGRNSLSNVEKYIPNGETIILKNAVKRDATFDGWYLTRDFSGDRITQIDTNSQVNYKLYAKWI